MPRPNLLFLFTDEQRPDTLGAYGNPRIHTPNLDRLAAQSTLFDRAYVTQPVCTPSRCTLLTGLFPHTSGCTENNVPLDPDIPTLPEMLPAGEYATGYHGKWHLGDELYAQHGFADWVSVEDGYNAYFREGLDRDKRSDYHHWLVAQGLSPRNGRTFGRGEANRLPEPQGKPAFLAQTASRFIQQHNGGQPWCLFVNFLEPHMPFFSPRDAQYDPASIPLPASFEHPPTADQPLKARVFRDAYEQWGHSGLPLKTPEDWRRLIANYWGLASLVDTHVGTILDAIERSGQAENTIVVYTSDHGDMMGSHQLLAKCVQFEEALRVPLMVRLPGQAAGNRLRGPVSQIDVVPTLLELMNAPRPAHLEGESLAPVLRDAAAGAPNVASFARDVFVEWNGYNSGVTGEDKGGVRLPDAWKGRLTPEQLCDAVGDPVRTVVTPEGWKFNGSPAGRHELYDLTADPCETRNLAPDPAHRPRMRDLRERIVQWQRRTGDRVQLPEI